MYQSLGLGNTFVSDVDYLNDVWHIYVNGEPSPADDKYWINRLHGRTNPDGQPPITRADMPGLFRVWPSNKYGGATGAPVLTEEDVYKTSWGPGSGPWITEEGDIVGAAPPPPPPPPAPAPPPPASVAPPAAVSMMPPIQYSYPPVSFPDLSSIPTWGWFAIAGGLFLLFRGRE